MKKIIVFRCDASNKTGWGHMIRELAVASFLKNKNRVIFASERNKDILKIKKDGYELFFKKILETEENFLKRIKKNLRPHILIIDKKYSYNPKIIKEIKSKEFKVIAVDNYYEGLREMDEIVFPTAHLEKEIVRQFMSKNKLKNIKSGFDYIILRKEILALRKKSKNENKKGVIVSMGGTDPEGLTFLAIGLLKKINSTEEIKILVSKAFKFKERLNKIKKNLPSNFKILDYSPEYLPKARLAFCAFGVTVYEMIYLGVPVICVSHTKENAGGEKLLEKKGFIKGLGYFKDIKEKSAIDKIRKMVKDKNLKNRAQKFSKLIDGKGAERIAKLIIK